MKHLTLFETTVAYNAATLNLPNVSLIEENMSVGYNPYVPETRVVTKYNVTDTSSPTTLRSSYEQNIFKSMEIDDVMLDELVTAYTFDTTGIHTVKYELYDETKLGNVAPVFDNGNLIECIIPDSVTIIGSSAFSGCTSLTSITIPDSVTSIGMGAFGGTDALKILNYNAKCELNTSFRSSWTNLETVIIGDSTPSISSGFFSNCTGLTSVTIGNNVTSISGGAFSGCSSLTSIVIPYSVTNIGTGVFSGCTSLTSMTVDNNNTIYDSRNNCNAIVNTTTNTLISGCKTTIIPDSVTGIGDGAFSGCSSLTSITIPDSVTSIGANVFAGCSNLTSITVDNNNTVYDSRNNCNAIIETITNTIISGCKTTIIPDSVTSIGVNAFYNCSSLTSIDISDSVTSIGGFAFYNCSGLTSIDIPDSVTSIGSSTFSGCSNLTSVTIGSGVTSIGSSTFLGCNSLTSINIPDSVTSIGDSAFYECSGLTSVTIGNGVTSIGTNTFYKCSDLASIVCNAMTAPTIVSNTFNNVKTDGTLTVPNGSTGYDAWMQNASYYLGNYNWSKVEQ